MNCKKDPQVHVQVIDPSEYNLPMPGTDWSAPGAKKLQEAVKHATAVVLATPEYHGSFSSVMKLVIENLRLPVRVARQTSGAHGRGCGSDRRHQVTGATAQCRGSRGRDCSAHASSVANVQSVFDSAGHITDAAIENTIRGVARNVMEYIHGNVCPRVTLERLMREGAVAGAH